jgi:hypothetical protein
MPIPPPDSALFGGGEPDWQPGDAPARGDPALFSRGGVAACPELIGINLAGCLAPC